ncbi:hypothetical protein Fmac_016810 [Flemingia macrophylla]|uniref:Uncharacterized protein n=1 Tax=Flemingia macrophylla TaxID=520843 RepID=A0ABD1MJ71_9FABA
MLKEAKKIVFFLPYRAFSSTPEKIPTLYSFLQPSVFPLTKKQSRTHFSATINHTPTHRSSLIDSIRNLTNVDAALKDKGFSADATTTELLIKWF